MSDVQHGFRHGPRGSDPARCDLWRYVGTDPEVPFINGFNSAPTAAVPNPSPLAFRLSVGPPNFLTYQTGGATYPPPATGIDTYMEHQIEIVGDVDGIVTGDLVFIIPLEYRRAYDTPYKGHDNFGNYVACRLLSTGEFYYGVP